MRKQLGQEPFDRDHGVGSTGFCITLIITLLLPALSHSAVYRCPDGAGGALFQQTPCLDGGEIELDIRTTKWKAAPQGDNGNSTATRSYPRGASTSARAAPAEHRQKQACWRTKQLIEKIEWELRKGYRPARGERLRRHRREQSDYLRAFCR